ncbi:amidohydrolase domain-containing protein [Sarocladium implicatum]|nr:amidohydrolase domain-containing protein [Sarocladium implicatum]
MNSIITLEEHFASRRITEANEETRALYNQFPPHLLAKLHDLDQTRIEDLDKGNVSLQILSHGPAEANAEICTAVNDELAAAVRKHPSRLAGFATLPMEDPPAAAAELERAVRELGFVGALVDCHVNGQFFDGEAYWPLFEKAQDLDVPIYIHPTFASEAMEANYKGNYPDSVGKALSAFGWGWHVETGHHILRLYASGLFDKYPKLKIIIGHMGELLPFQLDRTAGVMDRVSPKSRGLKQVWKENLWVTTSGMFTLPPLRCLLDTTPIDHVLYSVDYPFSANEKGYEFLEEIRRSELMSDGDLELFTHKNAEALLKVKVARA